jgi:hypothetical protein
MAAAVTMRQREFDLMAKHVILRNADAGGGEASRRFLSIWVDSEGNVITDRAYSVYIPSSRTWVLDVSRCVA